MVMPLSLSSGALSILEKSMASFAAGSNLAAIFVIAAVNVVLP